MYKYCYWMRGGDTLIAIGLLFDCCSLACALQQYPSNAGQAFWCPHFMTLDSVFQQLQYWSASCGREHPFRLPRALGTHLPVRLNTSTAALDQGKIYLDHKNYIVFFLPMNKFAFSIENLIFFLVT